jgi:branched-chain amino acid transport system substrate-binding protein
MRETVNTPASSDLPAGSKRHRALPAGLAGPCRSALLRRSTPRIRARVKFVSLIALTSVTVCAVPALAGAKSVGRAASGSPIVVSQLAGSTGAYAIVGKEVFDGATMAVQQINASGGVMGRKIELNNFNDGGSATQANEEFRRALSDHSVVIMGSPDQGSTVAQLAEQYKIPDMGEVDEGALTIYPNGPSKPPLSWVWSNTLDGFGIGNLLADYTLKNCPKLAILHDPTTYGEGGNDGFIQTYTAAHAMKRIVLDDAIAEDWSSGSPVSLTSEIASIKKAGADCVEVWLTPQDQATFVTTMNHEGDHWTVLGSDNETSTNIFQQLAGKYAQGMIAPQLTSLVKVTPAIKKFEKDFSAKYHFQASLNAIGAYEGVFVLQKALTAAKSTSPTAIQSALNNLHGYNGLMGPLSYSLKEHTAIQAGDLTLVQWSDKSKSWHAIFTQKS